MLGLGESQRGVQRPARDLGAGERQEDAVHGLGPSRARAEQAAARQQIAAEDAQRQCQPDHEVLDHGRFSSAPRWATMRTSTPGGVARIRRCGSGSRSRAIPRGGSDSPTIT